jgi:hypothetical protein
MKYLLEKDKIEFKNVLDYISLNKDNRKADKTKEPKQLHATFNKHDMDINIIALECSGKKVTVNELIKDHLKNYDLEFVFKVKKMELQDDYYRLVATAYYSEPKFLSYIEKNKYYEKLNNLGRKIILNELKVDDRDIEINSDGVYKLKRGRNKYDAHLIGDIISKKLIMSIDKFVNLLQEVKNNEN